MERYCQGYLVAGDPEMALQQLANINDGDTFQRHETGQLRIAAHKATGNTDQVVRLLRERFIASPSSSALAGLAEFLSPEECQPIVDSMVSAFRKEPTLNFSFLDFALGGLEVSVAEQYMLERADQIDGDHYYQLAPFAKQFVEKESPLAATSRAS